jgi:oligopeptide transport system substrate-binding protein
MMSGETTSPYAQFFWVIENGRAVTPARRRRRLSGVRALAPDRLEIRLERRTPYFTGLLMHFAAFPVPRHAIEAHGRDVDRARSHARQRRLPLAARVPNDHVAAGKEPALLRRRDVRLDGVRYYGLEDRDAALLRFRAGELDVLRDFPAGSTEWLRENMPDAIRTPPYLGLSFLAVNHAREALQDRACARRCRWRWTGASFVERVLGSGEQPPGASSARDRRLPSPARASGTS